MSVKKSQQDILLWIQNWYYQYCNGDWEHNENINIRTIDNPGWRVTIDLEGTNCENRVFRNIEKEESQDNWYQCFLRDGKFEGAGGPCNLFEILCVFQEWAKS